MKNLLALVGAVVVIVAGGGWYLGWYKVGVEPNGSGHSKVEFDVNKQKVSDDLKKGRDAVENLIEQKKVDGQPTSLPLPGGGALTLPQLPSLPQTPQAVPLQYNSDGSLKTSIKIEVPPPPPLFPENK